jgi:hypothetical protein
LKPTLAVVEVPVAVRLPPSETCAISRITPLLSCVSIVAGWVTCCVALAVMTLPALVY